MKPQEKKRKKKKASVSFHFRVHKWCVLGEQKVSCLMQSLLLEEKVGGDSRFEATRGLGTLRNTGGGNGRKHLDTALSVLFVFIKKIFNEPVGTNTLWLKGRRENSSREDAQKVFTQYAQSLHVPPGLFITLAPGCAACKSSLWETIPYFSWWGLVGKASWDECLQL